MTLEKQADEILKHINSLGTFAIPYSSILDYAESNNITELSYIIDKLLIDNLIEQTIDDNPQKKLYRITIKGKDLLRFGGLSQVENDRQANALQARRTEGMQKQTLILNALIAFGTVTAAGYYLADLYIKTTRYERFECVSTFQVLTLFCLLLGLTLIVYTVNTLNNKKYKDHKQ